MITLVALLALAQPPVPAIGPVRTSTAAKISVRDLKRRLEDAIANGDHAIAALRQCEGEMVDTRAAADRAIASSGRIKQSLVGAPPAAPAESKAIEVVPRWLPWTFGGVVLGAASGGFAGDLFFADRGWHRGAGASIGGVLGAAAGGVLAAAIPLGVESAIGAFSP